MTEIIARSIELRTGVFLVCRLVNTFDGAQGVARFVQGRFPHDDARVIAVTPYHPAAYLFQPVGENGA